MINNKAIKIIEAVNILLSLNIGGMTLNMPCTYADFMKVKNGLVHLAIKCEHAYMADVGFIKISRSYIWEKKPSRIIFTA